MIDLDAILDEIDALAGPELLRDTDVTVEMLMARWGLSDSASMARAKRYLVEPGLYRAVRVYDADAGRQRTVYRRLGGDGGEGGRRGLE